MARMLGSCRSLWSVFEFRNAVLCARNGTVTLQTHQKHDLTDKIQNISIDPERLKEIDESPSGWVPPSEKVPDLPFSIRRSKMNNLPVYTDFKGGGTRHITIIRRIKGDLKAVEELLRAKLDKDLIIQLNELTGQVKIKGNHKDKVVTLMKELGF
ncbi:39S ribosomal protein L49, mitochondrial [Exaiptasia diaphana]|uniref:Large ribosomal subunit protein mL49 n=1 Tax=Exaiptasia diaphana TaxID=2652724 RepID=A0A913XCM0_EXADI|nr:39S ribosomal protein L49, mitochondrial [Exaiptasia diaphana]